MLAVALFQGTGWQDRMIRLAQRRRYPERYAAVTHVALVMDGTNTIESTGGHGVTRSTLTGRTYTLIPAPCDQEDATHAIRYAESCLGDEYGWYSIVGVALALITGTALTLGVQRHLICSVLVARALEHAGVIWPHDADSLTPADIAHDLEELWTSPISTPTN